MPLPQRMAERRRFQMIETVSRLLGLGPAQPLGPHRYAHNTKVPAGTPLTMLTLLCYTCFLIAPQIGGNPVANAELDTPCYDKLTYVYTK